MKIIFFLCFCLCCALQVKSQNEPEITLLTLKINTNALEKKRFVLSEVIFTSKKIVVQSINKDSIFREILWTDIKKITKFPYERIYYIYTLQKEIITFDSLSKSDKISFENIAEKQEKTVIKPKFWVYILVAPFYVFGLADSFF